MPGEFVGRPRPFWKILLYGILTFGVYGRVYLYKTIREIDGHEAKFLDLRLYRLGVILPIIGPLVVKFRLIHHAHTLVRHDVTAPRMHTGLLKVAAFVPWLPLVHVLLQRHVGKHWELHRRLDDLTGRRLMVDQLKHQAKTPEDKAKLALMEEELNVRQGAIDEARKAAIAIRDANYARDRARRQMKAAGVQEPLWKRVNVSSLTDRLPRPSPSPDPEPAEPTPHFAPAPAPLPPPRKGRAAASPAPEPAPEVAPAAPMPVEAPAPEPSPEPEAPKKRFGLFGKKAPKDEPAPAPDVATEPGAQPAPPPAEPPIDDAPKRRFGLFGRKEATTEASEPAPEPSPPTDSAPSETPAPETADAPKKRFGWFRKEKAPEPEPAPSEPTPAEAVAAPPPLPDLTPATPDPVPETQAVAAMAKARKRKAKKKA